MSHRIRTYDDCISWVFSNSPCLQELNATIQKLQDAVAAETNAREENEKEARSKAEDFQRHIDTLQEEHASAVQEGQSIQTKANEDIADLNSQLKRARSEYTAEQEGRDADNKEAETAADALKATIQKLLGFCRRWCDINMSPLVHWLVNVNPPWRETIGNIFLEIPRMISLTNDFGLGR